MIAQSWLMSPMNRVPEVTVDFWLIKLMAVTMGETAADFLAVNLGLGLIATTGLMVVVLVGVMFAQLSTKRYIPSAYWLAVVMLIDTFGVPLTTTTAVFSVALAATFAVWFAIERTLSIHAIFTDRREAFYWLAIFLTFALGTAVGDLISEYFALGYLATGIVFGLTIASLALGYFKLGLDLILGFWLAYILTRPLGPRWAICWQNRPSMVDWG